MNKITRMQLQDIIEQVIADINPGLTDDGLVDAIESGDYQEEAIAFIIEELQVELKPEKYEVPFMKGIEESLSNLTIRKN